MIGTLLSTVRAERRREAPKSKRLWGTSISLAAQAALSANGW
jgi:hypothetical protein